MAELLLILNVLFIYLKVGTKRKKETYADDAQDLETSVATVGRKYLDEENISMGECTEAIKTRPSRSEINNSVRRPI